MTLAILSTLDDPHALRLLSTIAGPHLRVHPPNTLPTPALLAALSDAFSSSTPTPTSPPSDGDLARAALALIAEQSATHAGLDSILDPEREPVRFGGLGTATVAITAALAILQTEVTFERTSTGTWTATVKKKAAGATLQTLAQLVMKSLGAGAPQTPLTILFLAANPSDTARIAIDREAREIDRRLLSARRRDAFRIEQAQAVRAADLQECLLRHRPEIVHFSGHGSGAGELLLEDETGYAGPVSPTAIAELFRILGRARCVVLNACFSEAQARAVAEQVDCVVGMTAAIPDTSAIAFAGAFYQALGYGEDVQTAFDLGRNQIDLLGLAQAAVPVLLVRGGVRAAAVRLAGEEGRP
jgi:hypothetical protein